MTTAQTPTTDEDWVTWLKAQEQLPCIYSTVVSPRSSMKFNNIIMKLRSFSLPYLTVLHVNYNKCWNLSWQRSPRRRPSVLTGPKETNKASEGCYKRQSESCQVIPHVSGSHCACHPATGHPCSSDRQWHQRPFAEAQTSTFREKFGELTLSERHTGTCTSQAAWEVNIKHVYSFQLQNKAGFKQEIPAGLWVIKHDRLCLI